MKAVVYINTTLKNINDKTVSVITQHIIEFDEFKKSNKKPNKLELTDYGYVTKSQKMMKKAKEVTPTLFIDKAEVLVDKNPYDVIIEELLGLISSYEKLELWVIDQKMQALLKDKINNIDFVSSSHMKLLEELRSKNLSVSLLYTVEDNPGFMQTVYSTEVIFNKYLKTNNRVLLIKSDPKYYWTPKKTKSDFIISRHLIYRNNPEQNQKEAYCLANYKKDDPIGLKTDYVAYYQYLPKDPIEEIELIKSLLRESLKDMEVICNIHTENLYNADSLRLYQIYGEHAFVTLVEGDHNRITVRTLSGNYIASEIKPVGIANAGMKNCSVIGMAGRDFIITHVLKRDIGIDGGVIDITDHYYDDKYKIKKEVDNKFKTAVKFKHNDIFKDKLEKDKTYRLKLICGIDIVDRNTLKRLESYKPKVYVFIKRLHDIVASYVTVLHIEETDDVIVWTNIYSNKVIIE